MLIFWATLTSKRKTTKVDQAYPPPAKVIVQPIDPATLRILYMKQIKLSSVHCNLNMW